LGLGFRVKVLGFRVQGLGFEVKGLGFTARESLHHVIVESSRSKNNYLTKNV